MGIKVPRIATKPAFIEHNVADPSISRIVDGVADELTRLRARTQVFNSAVDGIVPRTGAAAFTTFLRADGTWQSVSAASIFDATHPGIVPASGGGVLNFLRADGTWAAPPVGTGDVMHTRAINTTLPLTGGGDLSADRTIAINTVSAGASGVAPASGGGTANFLRADATWAPPPGETVQQGWIASSLRL